MLMGIASTVFVSLSATSIVLCFNSATIETYLESHNKAFSKTCLRKIYNFNSCFSYPFRRIYNYICGYNFKGYNGGCIDQIVVYPLKSVSQGVTFDKWIIDKHGLKGDRQFMLASYNEENKNYDRVTLTKYHKLFTPKIVFKDGNFIVTYNTGSFQLPLEVDDDFICKNSSHGLKELNLNLYSYYFPGYELDKILPSSFIEEMEIPRNTVILFSKIGKEYTYGADKKTLFQDYFPLLMCSIESWRSVQETIGNAAPYVKLSAFRPNIVIKNVSRPFAEDCYGNFELINSSGKKHKFFAPSHCVRCSIPNINVELGVIDPKSNVSKSMSRFRRVDELTYSTCFGVYVTNLEDNYVIQKNDKLDVLTKSVKVFSFNPWK